MDGCLDRFSFLKEKRREEKKRKEKLGVFHAGIYGILIDNACDVCMYVCLYVCIYLMVLRSGFFCQNSRLRYCIICNVVCLISFSTPTPYLILLYFYSPD